MIGYSATARRHVAELTTYYRKKRRPEAIITLTAALGRAANAIEAGPRWPCDFPATYRNLARPGRAWIKEGRYWIAYDVTEPPVIVAVFWDGADIDRRYSEPL